MEFTHKVMNWKCDRCGSEEVQQEYAIMLDMNTEGFEKSIEDCYETDFYYCTQCDDECNPIRDNE